ncbi:MAG: hypothetical protein OXF02_07070 [Simkaniaceae bacterium]|nr:hypothetical protein [Simkaniaceae bacterium]
MRASLPTIILRHRKENLRKCSLRGLEGRSDLLFFTYPDERPPPLDEYLYLTSDAPPLTEEDARRGLFLIDATWNRAKTMAGRVALPRVWRSLPRGIVTAYPRRQTGCDNPERGLASVEALYGAYVITGRCVEGLLDHYYPGDTFLARNDFGSVNRG